MYAIVSFPFLCVRLFRTATISVALREHSAPNVIAFSYGVNLGLREPWLPGKKIKNNIVYSSDHTDEFA